VTSARCVLLRVISSFVVLLVVAGAAGCGGSSTGPVVASVGSVKITQGELSHWMQTLASGEYYDLSRAHLFPLGLVSDPPNYGACVKRLEDIEAPRAGRKTQDAAQLLNKCREMHQALKLQAAEFLVSIPWTEGVLREQGVTANDGETRQELDQMRVRRYPKPREFTAFLTTHRRSFADQLVFAKLDLLAHKGVELNLASKQVQVRLSEAEQRWTAKTRCRPGYVVKHCSQYGSASTSTSSSDPSAAVLMEQVAVLTGVPCINKPACS
jgi:hypothetical protein